MKASNWKFFPAGNIFIKQQKFSINCEEYRKPIYHNHTSDYTKNYYKRDNFIVYLYILIYGYNLMQENHINLDIIQQKARFLNLSSPVHL